MIFSVSNDGIQWTLGFGPDSVAIAVNDLDQNLTISSQEKPLASWQLLLSQRQAFFNNHPAQVPITPNQQGTFEMREEILYSVGAQDMDTSSYQVSDLEDIAFNWEDSQFDMDAVFRPGIDNPFSPTTSDDLLMGDGSVENPIMSDQEEDKENAPPATTIESVRLTELPSSLLEQEWKVYPIMFLEICFNRYYRVCVLISFIINVFDFIVTFFKN